MSKNTKKAVGRARITFTDAQQKSICKRYKDNESSISLSEEYGVSSNVILRVLRDNKIKIRGPGRYANAS